jgi:hypothetical protein
MKKIAIFFGALTLVLVLFGVLIASSLPDGLEHVAESLGFADRAGDGAWSPFADYETRFFGSEWWAQASAGLLGVAIMYGFGLLLGRFVRRRGGR